MKKYMPRLVDTILEKRMNLYGAICIEGCKWCGKSTTAKQHSKSLLELQNPVTFENNMEIAKTRPDLLLQGEKPRLIDEWQDAPMIWDAIRYDVDNTGLKGQYILTGSATPREYKPRHTGTGRIVKLLMRPMSLYESNESVGTVSLKELFENNIDINGVSKLKLEDIAFLCAKGGWPAGIEFKGEDSYTIARDYLESIIKNDIKTVDGVERNETRTRMILRSLARNISTTANLSVIREDTKTNDNDISEKTIADYLKALEKLYIIDDVEAWQPKLRSKTDIRTSKKREFVDPSIAVASLRATDKDLLKDFKTFGLIFESLCIRDLKIYSQNIDGEVFYYRDKNGLECDAIIHLHDGKWGAIEIKLGSNEAIEEAAQNLLKFKDSVDITKMNEPSFLMVLTATEYAYKRNDGVYVVPLGTLRN
ncbi:MAG: ATP-binding protein [Clostridia bacterium]|nr:ATP-binding protein [Clostridia bacterium]